MTSYFQNCGAPMWLFFLVGWLLSLQMFVIVDHTTVNAFTIAPDSVSLLARRQSEPTHLHWNPNLRRQSVSALGSSTTLGMFGATSSYFDSFQKPAPSSTAPTEDKYSYGPPQDTTYNNNGYNNGAANSEPVTETKPENPIAIVKEDTEKQQLFASDTYLERAFQLEEMEDKESCTTELILKADHTVEVGISDGPPHREAHGTWRVWDDDETLQIELTRVYDAGREEQTAWDMGKFTFTVTRRFIGRLQWIGTSQNVIVEGSIHDTDDYYSDREVGYFSMINTEQEGYENINDGVKVLAQPHEWNNYNNNNGSMEEQGSAAPSYSSLQREPQLQSGQQPSQPTPQYETLSQRQPQQESYSNSNNNNDWRLPQTAQSGGGDRPWMQSWIRK